MKHLRLSALMLALVIIFVTGCESTTISAKYGSVRRSFNKLEIPELTGEYIFERKTKNDKTAFSGRLDN